MFTMSTVALSCTTSDRTTAIETPRFDLEQTHSPLHIEGGVDSFENKAELDERDRDRGPHADNDGLRAEKSGGGGDVSQHPADEGVHELQCGNFDEHALGTGFHDHGVQVALELLGEFVMHVDLDSD